MHYHNNIDDSARIIALGAGRELLAKQYTTQNVATILATLTGDQLLRQRCKEVSALFKQRDGIAMPAETIEEKLHGKTA